MNELKHQRRHFIKSSAFGLIGITAVGSLSAETRISKTGNIGNAEPLFYRYPSMNDTMVSGIVGASHGNFDKVKELVNARPELAGAAWDWGFGDWETALGAASHVGRRDIAEFLISHGARPDIFTYTMMGMLKSVQEIIENVPGIQTHNGPHGITLLQHAKNHPIESPQLPVSCLPCQLLCHPGKQCRYLRHPLLLLPPFPHLERLHNRMSC